jgi:hypothetical protein
MNNLKNKKNLTIIMQVTDTQTYKGLAAYLRQRGKIK